MPGERSSEWSAKGTGIAARAAPPVHSPLCPVCDSGVRRAMSAEPTVRRTWPVWVGLGLYTAVRLALLPADPEVVPGFSHDSNYIAIVANNLLAGRGYVNDALWLVFLQPEQLPVPYHNANPLFPTAVAGLTWLTGQSAAWTGLALSAASSAALFAALFVLAGLCVRPVWQQALLAAAGTFF